MASYDIDIVVHSNECLELGKDVNLVVGIPYGNRMAMPFAHKGLFVKNSEQYDLFIYGEDDILITETNIKAFCEVTTILPQTEIAGFFRFERDQTGKRYYPDVFHSFHFDPTSVRTRKGLVFAQFTNEHAGCYMLTQSQLKKAIETGGYNLKLRSGPYTIACTASTDPYKHCHMEKVLCISRFEEFLVHHQPNKFIGKAGIGHEEFAEQLSGIKELASSKGKGKHLFQIRTSLEKTNWWNKSYFETCTQELTESIANGSRTVLSVGCGYGVWESELIKRGIKLVGVPLDSIIRRVTEKKGIEVTDPDFNAARAQLTGRTFDCIVFINILHHLKFPSHVLRSFVSMLAENGRVIVTTPNFHHVSLLGMRLGLSRKRSPRFIHPIAEDARRMGEFQKSGLHLVTRSVLNKWFRQSGLLPQEIRYRCDGIYEKANHLTRCVFGKLLGHEILGIAGRRVSF